MSKVSDRADGAKERAAAIGLTGWRERPNAETALADLLMHGLAAFGNEDPALDIVLGVAAHLDTMAMSMNEPMKVTLELQARRLRIAVDLAGQLTAV